VSTRAAVYLRISLDRTGDEAGVTRQRAACRRIAKERGWALVEEYVDNSKSAYAKNVKRPAYNRLVSDYRAGRFDALICWDLDRLTRQPRQLEDWIDAAEERGLVIVTVDGGTDLGTESGRQFARIKAAVARGEIEHKSKRQRAANDQRAEQGKPFAGRRAFGYAKSGGHIVKSEATVYLSAVDGLLAGDSLRAVTRMMNAHGAKTTAGNLWKPTEVRRLLSNPRHAGLRVHRGEVVGAGTWPAIVDEDTHRAVVALLSDPSRRPKGRPRAYLLSGIGRCGACGSDVVSRIYGRIERRGPIYVCEGSPHMGRRIEPVDEFIGAVVVARLSRPDAVPLFAKPDTSGRLANLRDEERRLTARLDGLAEAFALGDIDRRQLTAGTARLRAGLEDIAAEMPSLVATPAVAQLIRAQDVAASWEGLSTEAKREVVGTLMVVTLYPPGRGARTFRPETVAVEWRSP
jgi:DNA invertase Pin-like site-specific DNA recombinase